MRSQSLPMYAIAVIIIGLVVLAVFLLYSFGVFSSSKGMFNQWFSWGSGKTNQAKQVAGSLSSTTGSSGLEPGMHQE